MQKLDMSDRAANIFDAYIKGGPLPCLVPNGLQFLHFDKDNAVYQVQSQKAGARAMAFSP